MKENNIPLDGLDNQQIRVLVVDDDPDIVDLFVDVLQKDPRFEVAAARTGSPVAVGTDIDKPSVRIAAENAKLNKAPARFVHASGLGHRAVREQAPYDLVFANILAPPLVALAQDIKGALVPGGIAILSGLLRTQERRVLAAYRSRGFKLVRRIHRDAWAALVLQRP